LDLPLDIFDPEQPNRISRKQGRLVNDEISVQELSEILEKDPNAVLIDVREQPEYDEGHLGGKLIPLTEFERRWQEVPKDVPAYIYCRSGRRSRTALEFLKKQGYEKGFNVTGGILAWYNEINPDGR
jgi:rhodanese-related sulfurtransferase